MKIKLIESILDSIDPYQLMKDTGFTVKSYTKTWKDREEKNYQLFLKDNKIKIFNSGFLNLDIYSDLDNQEFIAGSGIDILAYYYDNNYTKALDVFFKLYGTELKSRLIHGPSFIKNLVKNIFIKRHNVINFIVKKLLSENSFINNIPYKTWVSKNFNTTALNIKGFAFPCNSIDLHKLLAFIFSSEYIDYKQVDNLNYKEYSWKNVLKFCNIYSDSDQWIVIPYFANHYTLSALKIINPNNNNIYTINVEDTKISYAGIYAFNSNISFEEKIRIVSSPFDALKLLGQSKLLLNNDLKHYVHYNINLDGINPSATNSVNLIKRAIYLNEPDKNDINLNDIRELNGVISNFYICNFQNYLESDTVVTWNDFLVKELVNIIKEDNYLSNRVKQFLSVIDFSNIHLKKKFSKWLQKKGYIDIYTKLNELDNVVHQFKSYTITSTNNGYILTFLKNNESIILTNYTIKIDRNILFKDKDDIMVIGRLVMGDNEYPIKFFKKELNKSNALDTISIRAFTNYNFADSIFALTSVPTIEEKTIPTVLDKKYHNSIITVINNEIPKAPCVQGSLTIGWDKFSNSFSAPGWKVDSFKLTEYPQYFYNKSPLDNVFEKAIPEDTEEILYSNMAFLNVDIKNILSVILSYLYRTYYGYEVKPFYIYDDKNSRNLIKFIFAALGQYRYFELDPNNRLINKNKLFENANNYPVYVRTNKLENLIKVQNYPYILFVNKSDINIEKEDINDIPLDEQDEEYIKNNKLIDEEEVYMVNIKLVDKEYKKTARFAYETLSRFFKWLFRTKVEDFDIKNHTIKNRNQLIEEGNIIFNKLWWEAVLKKCDRDFNAEMAMENLFAESTYHKLSRYFTYCPLYDAYKVRYIHRTDKLIRSKIGVIVNNLRKRNLAYINESNEVILDKDWFENCTKNYPNSQGKYIDLRNNNRIYLARNKIQSSTHNHQIRFNNRIIKLYDINKEVEEKEISRLLQEIPTDLETGLFKQTDYINV